MKTGQLAEWLNVSDGTVKNWTSKFADYLSDDAKGGDKHRQFTEMDIRIMLLIAALRDQNKPYDDIRATLADTQKAEWSELPQLPERPPGIGPVELMPVSEHESSVNLEKSRLLREIAIRQDQVISLETSLEGERAAHDGTREKLTEAREELGELRGKLTSTDAQIETITTAAKTERQLYRWVIIAVAVAAVVLLAVVVLLALQGGAA